jgi:hypothetical protein
VKALLNEEPVGGGEDLLSRALLLLGARHPHTVGICIPTVSEMQRPPRIRLLPRRI